MGQGGRVEVLEDGFEVVVPVMQAVAEAMKVFVEETEFLCFGWGHQPGGEDGHMFVFGESYLAEGDFTVTLLGDAFVTNSLQVMS